MTEERVFSRYGIAVAILIVGVSLCACSGSSSSRTALPADLLGISIGMPKAEAEARLREIAALDVKGQETGDLWRLRNDRHFGHVALDYDEKEKRVRYVTAFAEKPKGTVEKIKFADVGDLSTAKAEISAPHYRYIWEVAGEGDKPTYSVIVYGDNPEYVTIYSLSKKPDPVAPEALNTNQENS